jgi:hypothetical protein
VTGLGVFTSTYANYLVVSDLAMSASNTALTMRLRVSSADSSSANYYFAQVDDGAAATSGTAGTSWTMFRAAGVGLTWTDVHSALFVYNPQVANETVARHQGAGRFSSPGSLGFSGTYVYNATTQYDGFTIFPASGTITGSIHVYALRES